MRPCAYDNCKIGTKNIELGELYNRQAEQLALQGQIVASLDDQLGQILAALGVDDTPDALSAIVLLQAGARLATEHEAGVWRGSILQNDFARSIWNGVDGGEFTADDAASLVDALVARGDTYHNRALCLVQQCADLREDHRCEVAWANINIEIANDLTRQVNEMRKRDLVQGIHAAPEQEAEQPPMELSAALETLAKIRDDIESIDGDELARYAQ